MESLAARTRTGMWRTGQKIESAFTLLEVLVVLVILSLVGTAAALGLPNVRDRSKVMEASVWLNSTIVNLRTRARHEGRMTWLELSPVAGSYRLQQEGWRRLPAGVTWEVEIERYSDEVTGVVVFLPDGTGSGAAFTIRSGDYSAVHRIERFTGAIRHVLH